jgi:WD40 repeat protein
MAVAFSGDASRVISSGYESSIYWWDTKTAARDKLVGGHRVSVNEIAMSKDAKLFATAGGDGNVMLWDGASGTSQKTLTAGSLVYSVAINSDARLVAAGCYDGFVRLFEVKSGRHLLSLLELAGTASDADWLALTPEGFAAGSKALVEAGEWRMATRVIPSANVWKALNKPETIPAALRGDTLPAPAFQK